MCMTAAERPGARAVTRQGLAAPHVAGLEARGSIDARGVVPAKKLAHVANQAVICIKLADRAKELGAMRLVFLLMGQL